MKHVIIGGNGFVGRHLAADLLRAGETVVVADIEKSDLAHYSTVRFVPIDVTQPDSLRLIALEPDDVVYNLAAKMLAPIVPRRERYDFFWPVNYHGVKNVLEWIEDCGASRFVQFTTDMVYGHTSAEKTREDTPQNPLGEYGRSKSGAEELCVNWRAKGIRTTIFRPRLIIGPGRLGILTKLFKLIDLNLPVPLIGSGRNPYQFVSVFDCSSACMAAWRAGFPCQAYNIGSKDPPSVKELLGALIKDAGSRSILMPTPASLVKLTLAALDRIDRPLMDPEQYLIADEFCIRDTSAARTDLGWEPRYSDVDMLKAAYREYRQINNKEPQYREIKV